MCSHALNSLSNLTKAEKDRIEILLSPMKTLPRLWEVWTELVKNTTEQRAAFILLENEGHDENIKELLQQIVIEAALLLAPKCGSWLLDEQGTAVAYLHQPKSLQASTSALRCLVKKNYNIDKGLNCKTFRKPL